MIELFMAPTPNGWKISIMMEEAGLPYAVRWVDIGRGEQFEPLFQRISPNNKIPAIIDRQPNDAGAPISVFESGAILLYLADKARQFIPQDPRERTRVLEWLFWQAGGLGPMLGQHGHFRLYAPETLPYPLERYRRESLRLYAVMDRRLGEAPYLAGESYTIADIAAFPWIQTYRAQGIDLGNFGNVHRWYEILKLRPGLRRGMAVGRDRIARAPQADPVAREILFGIED